MKAKTVWLLASVLAVVTAFVMFGLLGFGDGSYGVDDTHYGVNY